MVERPPEAGGNDFQTRLTADASRGVRSRRDGEAKRLAAMVRYKERRVAPETGVLSSSSRGDRTEADAMWQEDQRRYYLLAARHLEDAREQGFPKGREALGLLLLGKSLCISREYTDSRPILEQAPSLSRTRRGNPLAAVPSLYLGPQPDFVKASPTTPNTWPTISCRAANVLRGCSSRDNSLQGRTSRGMPQSLGGNPRRFAGLRRCHRAARTTADEGGRAIGRNRVRRRPARGPQKYREAIDTLRKAQCAVAPAAKWCRNRCT